MFRLPQKAKQKSEEKGLTVWGHVAELRRYVLVSVMSVFLFGGLTHSVRNELVAILLWPLKGMTLQFLSPLDPLLFMLTLDLFGGVILSLPIILWSLYRFTAPALPRVGRWSVFFVLLAFVLLGGGAVGYGYFVAIPLTLSVLMSVTLPGTEASFTADGYLSFFFTALFMLVLVFELPLAMVAAARLGFIDPRALAKKRKYVYFALLVGVAVITPTTDLVSLALILFPTYAVFEVGLIGARMVSISER